MWRLISVVCVILGMAGVAHAQPCTPSTGPCVNNMQLGTPAISGGTINGSVSGSSTTMTFTTPSSAVVNNGLQFTQGYLGNHIGAPQNVAQWGAGSFVFGIESDTQHWCKLFTFCGGARPNGQFNNLESILTIPSGTATNQIDAMLASIDNFGSPEPTSFIAQCIEEISSSACLGINPVLMDSPNVSGANTSIRLQNEFDAAVGNGGNTIRDSLFNGYMIDGSSGSAGGGAPTSQVNWAAATAGIFSSSLYHWNIGFWGQNGATDVALLAGNATQQIFLATIDNGSGGAGNVLHVSSLLQGIPNGILVPGALSCRGPVSCGFTAANITAQTGGTTGGVGTYTIDGSAQHISSAIVLVENDAFGNPNHTGLLSQQVCFNYTDLTTGTTQRNVCEYVDPTLAASTGGNLRYASSYGGKVNPTVDNLAAFSSMNAAGTAVDSMLYLDGNNRTNLGSGTTETDVNSPNGYVVQFMGNVSSAVNNLKISPAATGNGPLIQSGHFLGGGDSNVDLRLNTLGTGSAIHLQVGTVDQAVVSSSGVAVTGKATINGHGVPYILDEGVASGSCSSQVNLHTTTIAGGTIGANGSLVVTTLWTDPGNSNTKTHLVALSTVSGSGGTNYLNTGNSSNTVVTIQRQTFIRNNNSTSSQIGFQSNGSTDWGTGTSQATSSLDTTGTLYLNFNCQSSGTDTMAVNYTVEVKNP